MGYDGTALNKTVCLNNTVLGGTYWLNNLEKIPQASGWEVHLHCLFKQVSLPGVNSKGTKHEFCFKVKICL